MNIITRAEAKEQGLKRYFTGKPCKHGHVSERLVSAQCVECVVKWRKENKGAIAAQVKKWREENKDAAAQAKEYYEKNKAYYAVKNKIWREENKGVIAVKQKKYYKENKEAIKKYYKENKEAIAARDKKYRKENPLSVFIRRTLHRIETAKGVERIDRAEVELGYTQQEFTDHIESQFTEGMSWGRRSEFHIDHIKPMSLFIKEGITDPAIINALSNLQPLWAKDNLSKGAKYD